MRHFLAFVGWVAALFAALAFFAAFAGKGGTDIQLIAAGIYGMIFVTAIGCAEIVAVLMQIRDKDKPKPVSDLDGA
jgi:hypothetical protein